MVESQSDKLDEVEAHWATRRSNRPSLPATRCL